MKLVIEVSDDVAGGTSVEPADGARGASSTTNGLADLQPMDGGPVPEVLLSMESEVAAGLRTAPHRG